EYRHVLPVALVTHDLDGDGDAEAIVIVETTDVHESGRAFATRAGRVWTARAGIALYAPARDLEPEAARDVDGDRRPDLITGGTVPVSPTFEHWPIEPRLTVNRPRSAASAFEMVAFFVLLVQAALSLLQICPTFDMTTHFPDDWL